MTSTDSWRPNWKDASKYPHPEHASALEWAWEFLRRDAKYRADFERSKTLDRTFSDSDGYKEYEKICSNYGLTKLTDPDTDYSRLSCSPFALDCAGVAILMHSHIANQWTPTDTRLRSIRQILPLEPTEITIKLDLASNAEQQIKEIAKLFEAEKQKTLEHEYDCEEKKYILIEHKISEPRRESGSLYLNHLRILDAKAQNASDSAIAAELFPKEPNGPPYPITDRIRKQKKIAQRMCQGGYRKLIRLEKDRSAEAYVYDLDIR